MKLTLRALFLYGGVQRTLLISILLHNVFLQYITPLWRPVIPRTELVLLTYTFPSVVYVLVCLTSHN